jgi:hypothetical protein
MTLEERLARHQRMADTYFDAYAHHVERGAVVMSDEWRIAPDFLYSSPYHGAGRPEKIATLMEGAGNTNEMRLYLAKMPDWRAVEMLGWPTPEGFVTKTRWEGHTRDGRAFEATLVNFWWVNAQGEITRCDASLNGDELGPVMELICGVRGPFATFREYWGALEARQRAYDAAGA